MDASTPSRRQFLALTGAGAGLSVAGCNALQSDGSDGSGGTEGSDRTATLLVQPDQQAIEEARSNVTQQLEAGEINQSEAQVTLQEEQQTVVADAVAAAESEIEDGQLSIDDRKDAQGALLVSGPATGLIDLLGSESVGALLDEATFEEIGQQAGPAPSG